ncbi:helix-turn-helix domain-containing protein [Peribacillus muralis]|uniref:helix-turn-helix domain-containing protein n=1 Tax=Peribacillus muralis TaxID=264697 RepID=UPI003CFDEE34
MIIKNYKARREFLRKERIKRKLTQQQVADYLGIKRSHYSNIENNNKNPGHSTAVKIADFFGIDHKKLLG